MINWFINQYSTYPPAVFAGYSQLLPSSSTQSECVTSKCEYWALTTLTLTLALCTSLCMCWCEYFAWLTRAANSFCLVAFLQLHCKRTRRCCRDRLSSISILFPPPSSSPSLYTVSRHPHELQIVFVLQLEAVNRCWGPLQQHLRTWVCVCVHACMCVCVTQWSTKGAGSGSTTKKKTDKKKQNQSERDYFRARSDRNLQLQEPRGPILRTHKHRFTHPYTHTHTAAHSLKLSRSLSLTLVSHSFP